LQAPDKQQAPGAGVVVVVLGGDVDVVVGVTEPHL